MSLQLQQRMAPGETIGYVADLSLWSFVPEYLLAFGAFCAAIAMVLLSSPDGPLGDTALYLAMLPSAIGVLALLRVLIVYYTTEIGVTNQRVLMKTGWIARNLRSVQLARVDSGDVDQSSAGRLLRFGNVNVRTAGEDTLVIPRIHKPFVLADVINRSVKPAVSELSGAAIVAAP